VETHILKKITNYPLWEIRILGGDSIRIICVALIKNEILIVHVFKKKSNKIKKSDISISMDRYKSELDK
jgi:phage-related protein